MTFRVIAAVLGAAALAGCSSQAPAPAPTTTTTSEAPGADPNVWFEAYCGPMGVSTIASLDVRNKSAGGVAAAKDAVVAWTARAASSDRLIADGIEKLGPLGSDVQSLHERLVKAKRDEAGRFDKASARLRDLAADDVFPERYQQVMAVELGSAEEQVTALFQQIATNPKYVDAFRMNRVCLDWQDLSKQVPGK